MNNNGTLLDAWEAFEKSGSKNIPSCQSALFRFTLPALGGRKPSRARLNSKDIAAARKVLASISISSDTVDRLREAQKQTFELLKTPKNRQGQLKFHLKQLIEWSIKNNFFSSIEATENKSKYTFYSKKITRIKTTNRKKISRFCFSFDVNDYVGDSLQFEQIQHHLQKVEQEFTKFIKYQTNQGIREVSIKNYTDSLKRILGWLYKSGKVSLFDISLSKLVPFIRLRFKTSEFSSEKNPWLSKIIAEANASENIKDEANRLVNLLTEYFEWLENPPSQKTKLSHVEGLIAYSKYVYRTETDKTMALNFEDIPLISRFKVFSREIKSSPNKQSNSTCKYLPWGDVLEVLEKLRFEAELDKYTRKNRKYKEKRRLRARAKSLQNFILMGFFVLVPPPRMRVVRDLELGKTLKHGIFENGRFTSSEKMANPSEAKYYIHLQPNDYKTGDTYGEWVGAFPNIEFPDGSKFYDYLDRWLFRGFQDECGEWHGMRKAVADPGAKTVFIGDTKGLYCAKTAITNKVKNIFTRWTGVAITPHDLRHLYRTYIDDPATEATDAEKESAAYWMRHSSQMAKKTYSHLSNEQKLRAGAQLSERLNQKLLNGKVVSPQ